MRSAPTLKIWITPFASVAMLEKLALLKIAAWSAPVVSNASGAPTSRTSRVRRDLSAVNTVVSGSSGPRRKSCFARHQGGLEDSPVQERVRARARLDSGLREV